MDTLPKEVNNFVAWPWPLLQLMEASMPGTQSFLAMEMRELKGANALLEFPVGESLLFWGLAMVQTRAFGTWNGGEALIPVAGLFNHHWDPGRAVPMPKCDLAARKCTCELGGGVLLLESRCSSTTGHGQTCSCSFAMDLLCLGTRGVQTSSFQF